MLSRFALSRQAFSAGRRFFSTNGPAVFVDANTKVICQGFTGKQVGIGTLCVLFFPNVSKGNFP